MYGLGLVFGSLCFFSLLCAVGRETGSESMRTDYIVAVISRGIGLNE